MYTVTARGIEHYYIHTKVNRKPEEHTIDFTASDIKKVRSIYGSDQVELDFRDPDGRAGLARAISFEFNKVEE